MEERREGGLTIIKPQLIGSPKWWFATEQAERLIFLRLTFAAACGLNHQWDEIPFGWVRDISEKFNLFNFAWHWSCTSESIDTRAWFKNGEACGVPCMGSSFTG